MKKIFLLSLIGLLLVSCKSEKAYDEKVKETLRYTVMSTVYSGIVCNSVQSAWHTAIYKKETLSGKYCSSFDDAVDEVLDGYKDDGTMDSLSYYNQKMIFAASEIVDPPSSRQDCYNDMIALVNDARELCRLAQTPTGSYKMYSEKMEELVDKLSKGFDQFTIKYRKALKLKREDE